MTKVCTKCNHEVPEEEFYKQARSSDGLDSWCKECRKENTRKYYRENREKMRAWHKNNYRENKKRGN